MSEGAAQKPDSKSGSMAEPRQDLTVPPAFCQYSAGPCDQEFVGTKQLRGLFLYPAEPESLAATIEGAVRLLRFADQKSVWKTWKDLHIGGQIVFCTICKHMRFAGGVVADVTTLNFNLLFEIGFALGLEIPIWPIRDTTFIKDRQSYDELGLLDTIGYLDFQNSETLANALSGTWPPKVIPAPVVGISREAPLYVLKGHIDTEGAVRLLSTLKKSALRFRTYDVLETPRLSLQEARRQVAASLGVVAHLLAPDRKGALVHNARCALVAGMAMATGKAVLLLQEGFTPQPIDYRDVVSVYTRPDQVPGFLERFIKLVVTRLQDVRLKAVRVPERLLERLDLGDVAAKNEIQSLRSYFVRTAQFNDARRGHARIVTGRKGAGKTAVFYAIRNSFGGHSSLVLDLKPEGHQFSKLRDAVLSQLSPGLQEHTLVAFWSYILLCELAQKIRDYEYSWAHRDDKRRGAFERLMSVYDRQVPGSAGDFSERLLMQVHKVSERFSQPHEALTGGQLTELLFRGEIRALDDVLAPYLMEKESVWVLVDNLDKGWPTRGASSSDIMTIRALLEATRKLQREFETRGADFHSLVFLRNDIYDHLIDETPDRGKDTVILLDWDDPEVLRTLVLERIKASTDLVGSFADVWPALFDTHVGTQDSFAYILDRTLMRPRDLLNFLHRAIEVAVNRGHERVRQDDIEKAERLFSEDILIETSFEIRDVYPQAADPLYGFLGAETELRADQVKPMLEEAGVPAKSVDECVRLLAWFGFLGVREGNDDARFSYQMRYNLAKLLEPVRRGRGHFVIHPAFRRALETRGA